MKHPHCNRSLSAHLFWCRGFAPVFFIVSVALIVIAVGSGLYFMSRPDVATAPVASIDTEQVAMSEEASTTSAETLAVAVSETATTVTAAKPVTPPTAPATPTVPKLTYAKPDDCGSGATAETCLTDHIAKCAAAKAIIADDETGVRVEHVVDGLISGKCSYRSMIVTAPDQFAILEGLDVRCALPTDQLLKILSAGDDSQLLQYCSGSYIDVLRQARGMAPAAQ